MPVQIIFEYGQQDRMSSVYGPYDYIQLTYNAVRVGPEGDRELAYYTPQGIWKTDDGQEWSDITISQA